ncbi:type I restriction-modification enzyme R subunit C-terminal domain-containing protein [Halopseudomonas pelagia]|uniref:type I restriction-modification enzyme R subunit C-terminal domain-containing protein n=1 Tax=Halopseudomonas pelagia TaxID=553151 RepID=UPI0030DD6FD1
MKRAKSKTSYIDQADEYWQDIRLPMLEQVRRRMRELERRPSNPVYSVLSDEIGEATVVNLKDFNTGINLAQYKKKVEAYIRANENHVAIAKLKFNRPLTPSDLSELEHFVYESEPVQSREQFEQCYGADKPLTLLIRSFFVQSFSCRYLACISTQKLVVSIPST